MSFSRYILAEHKLNQELIRLDLSLKYPEGKSKDPAVKMAEMNRFLCDLGNPEQGIPAIHVAGTSGKGSVCAAIAGILTQAGLKVGMHVSPYLQSATEKIWIADEFVSSDDFADLVDWVMPAANPLVHPDTVASIHGMASVAIAFEGFRRQKVDVIVVEVGCGGRFDLTSFVDTKVAVVTNIGWDHLASLGPTLEDIAWHKAGIARRGAPLITGATASSLEIIARESSQVGAPLIHIPPVGNPIAHNKNIAIEAARQFIQIVGGHLGKDAVYKGIERARLAGRFEAMPGKGPKIIIDGAHNAEKLTVAVNQALKNTGAGPKIAVIGLIGTKAKIEILKPLQGKFDHIIATEPSVYAKQICPAHQTAALLANLGCEAHIEADMFKAIESAKELAGDNGTVLVCGSFYLAGAVRDRWYPKKDIVSQRTSWPTSKLS